MNGKKDFIAVNVGTNIIEVNGKELGIDGNLWSVKPVILYLKEDGTLDDKPSIAIVSIGMHNEAYFSQISLKMLNEGLADIGYEFRKIN